MTRVPRVDVGETQAQCVTQRGGLQFSVLMLEGEGGIGTGQETVSRKDDQALRRTGERGGGL